MLRQKGIEAHGSRRRPTSPTSRPRRRTRVPRRASYAWEGAGGTPVPSRGLRAPPDGARGMIAAPGAAAVLVGQTLARRTLAEAVDAEQATAAILVVVAPRAYRSAADEIAAGVAPQSVAAKPGIAAWWPASTSAASLRAQRWIVDDLAGAATTHEARHALRWARATGIPSPAEAWAAGHRVRRRDHHAVVRGTRHVGPDVRGHHVGHGRHRLIVGWSGHVHRRRAHVGGRDGHVCASGRLVGPPVAAAPEQHYGHRACRGSHHRRPPIWSDTPSRCGTTIALAGDRPLPRGARIHQKSPAAATAPPTPNATFAPVSRVS